MEVRAYREKPVASEAPKGTAQALWAYLALAGSILARCFCAVISACMTAVRKQHWRWTAAATNSSQAHEHRISTNCPPTSVVEHDFLGEKQIPADAYWGVHTARAVENFPISGTPISAMPRPVRAFGYVKKAAAPRQRRAGRARPQAGRRHHAAPATS